MNLSGENTGPKPSYTSKPTPQNPNLTALITPPLTYHDGALVLDGLHILSKIPEMSSAGFRRTKGLREHRTERWRRGMRTRDFDPFRTQGSGRTLRTLLGLRMEGSRNLAPFFSGWGGKFLERSLVYRKPRPAVGAEDLVPCPLAVLIADVQQIPFATRSKVLVRSGTKKTRTEMAFKKGWGQSLIYDALRGG